MSDITLLWNSELYTTPQLHNTPLDVQVDTVLADILERHGKKMDALPRDQVASEI